MIVGEIKYYGLKQDVFTAMTVTEIPECEEGYTLVVSFELVETHNGNGKYKMKLYQDATPKNLVINGWQINHEYTIFYNWSGVSWEIDVKDVFGNKVEISIPQSNRYPDEGKSLFFTTLYNTITYSTPKLSAIFYAMEHGMWNRIDTKEIGKELYMEIMDDMSHIENMKKLANDELANLSAPNLLEFNLRYMDLVDKISHYIVKD